MVVGGVCNVGSIHHFWWFSEMVCSCFDPMVFDGVQFIVLEVLMGFSVASIRTFRWFSIEFAMLVRSVNFGGFDKCLRLPRCVVFGGFR